tara:strand:+ start:2148 stop:2912 length:765 start_codon:yes stop_codon:yes gene_type:complete
MRPSNKRSRSNKNRPRSLGNVVNRVFDSSGPEGKVRGTPQQIIDKYTVLARDAQLSGDRVAAENFQQHAEHYTRMLNEALAEQAKEAEARREQQQQQQQQGRRNDQRDDSGGNDGGGGGGGTDSDDGADPRPDNRSDRSDGRERRGNRRTGRRDNEQRDNRQSGSESADTSGAPQGDESDSMLVETPESRAGGAPVPLQAAPAPTPAPTDSTDKPKRARKPRKPRAEGEQSADQPSDQASEQVASDAGTTVTPD